MTAPFGIYFPHVDEDGATFAELRACDASKEEGTGGPVVRAIQNSGTTSETEVRIATQAALSVRTWERAQSQDAPATSQVSIYLSSSWSSKGRSCQAAVAAADWLARRADKVTPKAMLVATGAFAEGRPKDARVLPIEPVGQVLEKAKAVRSAFIGGSGPLRNQPFLFCYPKANAGDPGLAQELASWPPNALHAAVATFEDLLEAWASNAKPMDPKPNRFRLLTLRVAGSLLLFLAAGVAAMIVANPEVARRLETWADAIWAPAAAGQTLVILSRTAATDPDHPASGCTALLASAERGEIGRGIGWQAVSGRIAACRAAETCDRLAASPADRPQGRQLAQLAADRAALLAARENCAAAEAAFPQIGRFAFQLSRALGADADPSLAEATRLARERARPHSPLAEADHWTRIAPRDPAAARMNFSLMARAADAHPYVLRAYADLLACGLLRDSRAGPDTAAGDLRLATELLARAQASPRFALMSGEERFVFEAQLVSLRAAIAAGTTAQRGWCDAVERLAARS
jgi:hypothetical protein